MADSPDGSWTRALMASSGIAVGQRTTPIHATSEQLEARYSATGFARLQKLAMAGDETVRAAVAGRPDCPLGLLAALSHDRRVDVRVAVAGNSRITDAVAQHLVGDRDVRVLKALARNAKVAPGIIEMLAHHRKSDVRRVASREIDARWGTVESTAPPVPRVSGLPAELHDRVPAMPAPEFTPARPEPGGPHSRPAAFGPLVT